MAFTPVVPRIPRIYDTAPRQDRRRARRASAVRGSQCQRERAILLRSHAPLPADGERLQRLRDGGLQAARRTVAGSSRTRQVLDEMAALGVTHVMVDTRQWTSVTLPRNAALG